MRREKSRGIASRRTNLLAGALAALAMGLAGCGSMPGSGNLREVSDPARYLPGVPLPAGSKVDLERTLILGNGPDWTGRVAGETGLSEDDLVRHFTEQLGKAGWRLVTVARSRASLMTLTSGPRVATIEVAPGGGFGGGSTYSIVVSPQAAASATGTPPGATPTR